MKFRWIRMAHALKLLVLGLFVALVACDRKPTNGAEVADASAHRPTREDLAEARTAQTGSTDADGGAANPAPTQGQAKTEPNDLVGWLKKNLPAGGSVMTSDDGAARVVHRVLPGETQETIAAAYLELTDVYKAEELAGLIAKAGPVSPGATIVIPKIVMEVPKSPRDDRRGWPPERALRGVFLTGWYAADHWIETLDRLAARKLNAVVLDGKDYEGPVTYPSKAKIAVETGAVPAKPPIPNMARAIRFAHQRGVHVIVRIACFHDPLAHKKAPRLAIMGNWGGPYHNGWLDPMNPEAQEYILELAQEAVDNGADEVQLDYIRFPVTGAGLDKTKLPPPHERSKKIREFVAKVHALTNAAGVPLSLDTFGVTATGDQSDIDRLGQDLGTIGSEADALSPMVYPSHYANGWLGFAEPGAHPEISGIGTKATLQKLRAAHNTRTIVRTWLQAFPMKAPNYGPKYITDQIRSVEAAGGVGWLLWNPGCDYWAAWKAIPVIDGGALAQSHP